MDDTSRQLLTDAIARNCAVVLSLPSAGLLHNHKSRFLAPTAEGIWVETAVDHHPLVKELIATQVQVGITFKAGQQKVIFASPALAVDVAFAINDELSIPAVKIAWPLDIKAIQRRENYRVRIFPGCDLTARAWRIAPRVKIEDQVMPSQELTIVLHDLSLGGIGVTFHPKDGKAQKVIPEDRLRLQIIQADITLLLEGQMRLPAGGQQPNTICTGIRFKEMDGNLEGRLKLSQLTRILGAMQREEVRRARLGLI